MVGSCDLTCANIALIDAMGLRIKSFALIVMKSEVTDAKSASIIASCEAIVGTYAVTFVICATTVEMRAETKVETGGTLRKGRRKVLSPLFLTEPLDKYTVRDNSTSEPRSGSDRVCVGLLGR